MRSFGGAAIPMPQNFDFGHIAFLTGSAAIIEDCGSVQAKAPFDERMCEFLNAVSKNLLSQRETKAYSDVATFAFWIRKASTVRMRDKFAFSGTEKHMGKGVLFHIAPSNVPVNFAYSLAVGLLTGNVNIVRVPSKHFPQVDLIAKAFEKTLGEYKEIRPYVCLIRYERDRGINDCLSALCDMRIVWGGDATIAELRKSPLAPRAGEITFADRFSLSVLDSDAYMKIDNKQRVTEDFYNDTYLSDQNACTSPRFVIWTGSQIEAAKDCFWSLLHKAVSERYRLQPIQAVSKLASAYQTSAQMRNVRVEPSDDNLIVRVRVPKLACDLIGRKDNSGYFFEYDCDNILELQELCNDRRCQTIGYVGDAKMFAPLLAAGVKGVDRIVPVGKTMEFDLVWDGYDLTRCLTRTIAIEQ